MKSYFLIAIALDRNIEMIETIEFRIFLFYFRQMSYIYYYFLNSFSQNSRHIG